MKPDFWEEEHGNSFLIWTVLMHPSLSCWCRLDWRWNRTSSYYRNRLCCLVSSVFIWVTLEVIWNWWFSIRRSGTGALSVAEALIDHALDLNLLDGKWSHHKGYISHLPVLGTEAETPGTCSFSRSFTSSVQSSRSLFNGLDFKRNI